MRSSQTDATEEKIIASPALVFPLRESSGTASLRIEHEDQAMSYPNSLTGETVLGRPAVT